MEKRDEQIHADQWLKDVSLEPEIQGFRAEEMISCPKCERKSPPTRLKCFYCNAELPVSAEQSKFIKLQPRKMEDWEKGFNLIVLPNAQPGDDRALKEAAGMTRLEKEDLRKLLEAKKALPFARAESEKEAGIMAKRLSEINFESRVISDEDLKIESVTRRLRGIEFRDDKLILIHFNSDEITEIKREEARLIVTGALFERRIEAIERRKKKSVRRTTDSIETSADELLIDLYTPSDAVGYRIFSGGFDFSCLETEKGILARENMRKLADKLRAFAPEAGFVGDYLEIRDILGKVWEVEEKRESRGLQRKSFGRFDFENVTTINNLAQFTKYSRLQWHLL